MATQVEALLPGNPLQKAEEQHGKVIRGEPVEEEGDGGAKQRQTEMGVAEEGSSSSGSSPTTTGQGGGGVTEEQTSKAATEAAAAEEESKEGGCHDSEDGVKGRKEFTEAPPPKVNPWTRKMNNAVVTVVSVNGQASHHGA